MNSDEVYLDDLLGRVVVARNNRAVGRLEEFHTEQHGDYFHIVEFVIGSAGLMDRLNMGVRALFGKGASGKIARPDQIDITDPTRPRLTCSIRDLQDLEG